MSHIAEVYAKDLGVKIGKPTITEHYFPNTKDLYVCFNFGTKSEPNQYKYWDIVRSLVLPYLNNQNIHFLEIPQASNKQKNFFIKNSLLYLGAANHYVNVADNYGIPSVSILSNVYENNFNLFDKALVLTPDFSEIKPSFGPKCQRINEIKPEKIAQAVLDQLGIKQKIKFKTIKAGSKFAEDTFDIVPNFFGYSKELEGKPVNIRGDLHFDLSHIASWCQMCVVNLWICETFDTQYLKYMPNLKQVIYKYDEHEKTDISEFLKILKNKKINVVIEAQDKDKISDIRLKYFDFMVLEKRPPHEEIKASKFISRKKFISDAQVFNSESSANRLDKSNNFVYDEASSKELESLYLYDEE